MEIRFRGLRSRPERDDRPTIGEHVHYKTMTHLFRPNCRGITGLEDVTRIRGNRFPARTSTRRRRKKKREREREREREKRKKENSWVQRRSFTLSRVIYHSPFLDSLTLPPTSLLASSREASSRGNTRDPSHIFLLCLRIYIFCHCWKNLSVLVCQFCIFEVSKR